jgi:hypothetical protein
LFSSAAGAAAADAGAGGSVHGEGVCGAGHPPVHGQQHRVIRLDGLLPLLQRALGATLVAGAGAVVTGVEQLVPALQEETSVQRPALK